MLLNDLGTEAPPYQPPKGTPNSQNAESQPHLAQPRFDIASTTHIITEAWNFPENNWIDYDNTQTERLGKSLWIVKPAWVIKSLLHDGQGPEFYSADPKMIFSSTILHCAEGLLRGDVAAITGVVQTFGGQCRDAMTKEVTHIVMANRSDEIIQAIRDANLHISIVCPEWIHASVGMMRLAPEKAYEYTIASDPIIRREDIYNGVEPASKKMTEITMEKTRDQYLGTDEYQKALCWAARQDSDNPPKIIDPADFKNDVLQGRKILFGAELEIGQEYKALLDLCATRCGGVALEDESQMAETDIYVTKWREGSNFARAVKMGKTIGTLLWFFHIIKIGRLTSPLDELLNYPVPREPVEGFSEMRIAVSNYTGDTREYVKRMIVSLGGFWTNSLSRTGNTHLIAAK